MLLTAKIVVISYNLSKSTVFFAFMTRNAKGMCVTKKSEVMKMAKRRPSGDGMVRQNRSRAQEEWHSKT